MNLQSDRKGNVNNVKRSIDLSVSRSQVATVSSYCFSLKKRRRRTIITGEQLTSLENLYMQEQWPSKSKKEKLAAEIGTSEHFVSIWFQNKRARVKRESEEKSIKIRHRSRAMELPHPSFSYTRSPDLSKLSSRSRSTTRNTAGENDYKLSTGNVFSTGFPDEIGSGGNNMRQTITTQTKELREGVACKLIPSSNEKMLSNKTTKENLRNVSYPKLRSYMI